MPEKRMRRISDKDKRRIAEKMAEFVLLMGSNADYKLVIAKELNRQIWMDSELLGRKQCKEFLYLLYMADSATLLSFTASLGRVIWSSHLRAKRKNAERRLLDKIRLREMVKKKRRMRGRARLAVMVKRCGNLKGIVQKGCSGILWNRIGFDVKPRCLYRTVRRRAVNQYVEAGSRVHRLALAMGFLSFRNVCVTSEWEFYAICLVQQVFGFWRSVAIEGGLSAYFTSVAHEIGLDVVSREHLERLQSCFRCSSTARYPGYEREYP